MLICLGALLGRLCSNTNTRDTPQFTAHHTETAVLPRSYDIKFTFSRLFPRPHRILQTFFDCRTRNFFNMSWLFSAWVYLKCFSSGRTFSPSWEKATTPEHQRSIWNGACIQQGSTGQWSLCWFQPEISGLWGKSAGYKGHGKNDGVNDFIEGMNNEREHH